MPTIRLEAAYPGGGQIPWPPLLPVTLPAAVAAELVAAGHARMLSAPGTVQMEAVYPGGGMIPLPAGATALVPQRIADELVGAGMAVVTADDTTPTLASISPTTRVAGTAPFTLTCTGSSFSLISEVLVAGEVVPSTYVSPTSLTAQLTPPAVAGSVLVGVRNGNKLSVSRTLTYTATAGDAPEPDPTCPEEANHERHPEPRAGHRRPAGR